MFRFHRLVI